MMTSSESSSSSLSFNSSFPFDHVKITFPDARSAALAQERFQHSSSSCRITCKCDPYGTRVGSAGGTAAALVDHPQQQKDDDDETVLILHAGGAASRSPTQMILGKAWTTFPSSLSVSNHPNRTTNDSSPTSHGVTLMDLWLSSAQHLFRGIPRSSIVVIAADTLLEFEDGISASQQPWMDWNQVFMDDTDHGGIVCLAVPAPLETAQNHGVFVLDNSQNHHPNNDTDQTAMSSTPRAALLRSCHRMLQKPSLLELSSIANHTEDVWWRENDEEVTKTVWIDTGVTIFGPSAARAFRHLARNHMQSCTATGLWNLFQQQQQVSTNDGEVEPIRTLWIRQHALSVDLYTHILRAVMVDMSRESYLQIHEKDGLSDKLLSTIYDTLSIHSPLQILAIPKGRFWHLGTTRELHEFMVYGAGHCYVDKKDPESTAMTQQTRQIQRCQEFGRKLRLRRRIQTFITLGAVGGDEEVGGEDDGTRRSNGIDESAVISNSMLIVDNNCCTQDVTEHNHNSSNNGSTIGADTLIEYCRIETTHRIRVGNRCFISGFRTGHLEEEIYIPDRSMVLMTRIISKLESKHESQKITNSSPYAIVVLGICDAIKERVTSLFGIPVDAFLRDAGVHDIWDDSDTADVENSLWNAKLHPMISLDEGQSFSSVYSWLRLLDLEKKGFLVSKLQADDSFQNWKNSKRLSLSKIREMADAQHEFAFRDTLWNSIRQCRSEHLNQIGAILKSRKNYPPFDAKYIVDEFASANATVNSGNRISGCVAIFSIVKEALQAWDKIVRESLLAGENNHDIASRTCMMMSSFLDELAEKVPLSVYEGDSTLLNQMRAILAQTVAALHCTAAELLRIYDELATIRDEHLASATILAALSEKLEDFAGILTGKHICLAPGAESSLHSCEPIYDQWILATAPARIDLAGGWTDTPPSTL
jgi:fucokinase